MSVFRRKMFGGGYAHRGTGITSGLTKPKRGYVNEPGSYAGEDYDEFSSPYVPKDTEELSPMHISGSGGTDIIKSITDYPIYRELFKATLPERKKLSREELMLEPWMTFFSNLGKPTFKKGFGAVSENIREAAAAATPAIGKSLEIKRQFEEAGRQEEAQVSQLALQKAMETTAEGTIKDIPIGLFNQMSRKEQERVLGIEDKHKDEQTVKSIPISIFNKLSKTEQGYILGTAKVPEEKDVKGIPRAIFDELSQPAKNKILGITDAPVMIKGIPENIFNDLSVEDQNRILVPSVKGDTVKGIPMKVWNKLSEDDQNKILVPTIAGEKVKGIPIEIWNKLSEDDQNKILVPTITGQTVKGIPIDIWNKFDENQQAIIAGAKSAKEQTVKGIPLSTFEGFSNADKAKILGIDDKATNLKVTEIDGNMVANWLVGDQLQQKVIGEAPALKAEDQTEFEKSVSDIQGTLGQPKNRYPGLEQGYGYISDGDNITQEDIDYIQQRMTNDFAMLKSTEKEGLTLQEEKNLARAKNIMENIETPLMTKIADAAKFSQKRQKVYEPILTSLQTFKPGAFVNARKTIGKWVELLGPEQLDGPLRNLLSAWKIGNPIAADILSVMSARLTLTNAEDGALPGNLNMKEFEELKQAGLPLWTTTEGAKIIAELYQREDDINIEANKMLGQISSQQDQGAIDSFTIELPDGKTEEFGSYLTALNYIDGFIDSETSSLVSGSTIMKTGSLSEQIGGLGRYNKETLNLEGKTIAWGKGVDAKEAFEDNKLDFVGFANPDSPEDSEMGQLIKRNPMWAGQAVYQYNTGELWKEGDFGFDPDLHKVNEMKFMYWSP